MSASRQISTFSDYQLQLQGFIFLSYTQPDDVFWKPKHVAGFTPVKYTLCSTDIMVVLKVKFKVKVALQQAMKGQRGSRGMNLLFL